MISSSNFIKLHLDEMMVKLKAVADQKEMIKIWIRGNDSQLYRCCDFFVFKGDEKRTAFLSLFSESKEIDDSFINKDIFLTFTLNETDYFSEGTVSLDEVHGHLIINLQEDFYRSEKRNNERLLTYPHHQVYVYFKVRTEKNESNIIELKREEDKLYIDYKQKKKQELKEKLKEKISDIEDLLGFRVLDISKSGVAFLVGEEEQKFFSGKGKYSFYILFDGDIFVVKGANLVYKVDYIGGQGSHYKVGLNFGPVEKLTNYVDAILKEGIQSDSVKKEFEEFIDD